MTPAVKGPPAELERTHRLLGVRYARLLVEAVDPGRLEALKRDFSYVSIYSYTDRALPGFAGREQPTALIDLSADLETIFRRFRKNTRNEIRKTERMPELGFRIPDEDDAGSYRFYASVKREAGVRPDVREDFRGSLWLNAYVEGAPAASVSVDDNGRVLRLRHIVTLRNRPGFDARIAGYATRRLIWEACKYGKERERRWVDLAGVIPDDPEKAGIAFFKECFGGTAGACFIHKYETRTFAAVRRIVGLFGRSVH